MSFDAIRTFRTKIESGKVCLGTGISFTDPLISDALGSAVDFLWIELEHGGQNPETVNAHLLAARAHGIPGIVRLPVGKTEFIKPVIDAGADGIIVPQVRTVDEVRQVVDDCRYPPMGHRGFGPRVPTDYFRHGDLNYIEQANRYLFVAVMIETLEAYEAIDEIVALPGLDSLVIGPSDLSWSLGTQGDFNHPKVVAAIETIVAKARSAGKTIGAGMGPDPEFALKMAQRGVQWMQVGMDCSILIKGWDEITASFRGRWDDLDK